MTSKITNTSPAGVIAAVLRRRGFRGCTAEQVWIVMEGGSLPDDPALESAILQEIEN